MEEQRSFGKTGAGYDREGFAAYLRNLERSPNTISAYLHAVSEFFSEEPEFSQEAVLRYKQGLSGRAKATTVNLRLCGLRTYAQYMQLPVLVKPIKIQKVPFAENVISQADYQKLLEGLAGDQNWKWYFLVKFLACTGARISELLQFRKKHLDDGYMELWTKGKIRMVYFPAKLLEESRDYYTGLGEDEFLFQGKKGALASRTVGVMFYKFSEKYGIPKKTMHPHSFRHRFAVNFLKKNNDISLLADIMGHSNVNTTMIYLRLSKEEQRNAVDCVVDW